jgi:two-component system sensor histidine kinase BarA
MIKEWLHRPGIGRRILLIFATPLLIAVLFLGYHVTVTHLADSRHDLEDRGRLLARHLGILSEFGMFSGNRDELQKYASHILREADVAYVIIEDRNRVALVSMGNTGPDHAQEDFIEFGSGITRSGVEVSDYEDDIDPADRLPGNKVVGHVRIGLSRQSVQAEQARILRVGIVATSSALLASILLALLVARSVSGPIVRLTRVVDKLTDGRLSVRSSEASPGELGTLEKGINNMARTLQDARSKLLREVRDATAALHATVTELENKNKEVEHARTVALQADAAKSVFLAKMSHEIRTPLGAIIGFSELLEKTAQSEDQHEYTRTIIQAASQLLIIIDDILNFTRLESGALTLEKAPFNLHECLENAVNILSAQAHDKKLELVLYIHSDVPPRILSDAKRIGQILTNLVSNAIKFTAQGHVIIEVSLLDTPGQDVTIHIAVTDTGIGLDESRATQVFDPFTQADASTSRIFGGTGLGLSICKKLVELLGGEIGLKSSPGQGTRLWFTLPHVHADPVDTLPAKPLAGVKALVYDENSFTRRALRNSFLSWGASVFNTSEWHRMLSMLTSAQQHKEPFSLLVAGLSSRQYSDRLVTEMLDDIRQIDDLPVLVLIGTETHHLRTAMAGMHNIRFISKPPRSDRMLRTVRQLLSVNEAEPAQNPSGYPASEIAETSDLAGLNILIAEDNRFNQAFLSRVLGGLDIAVTLAANGEEACQHASETVYDLIFMDIHMPVMGGLQATREIRKGINRQTPIIALTADVFANKDNYFDAYGLNDCIFKPVIKSSLVEMLRKWHNLTSARTTGDSSPATKEAVPADMLPGLHAELALQLDCLRAACSSGSQQDIQDHLHQLKGIVEYFNLAEFQSDFIQLREVIGSGCRDEIIIRLDALEAILAKSLQQP